MDATDCFKKAFGYTPTHQTRSPEPLGLIGLDPDCHDNLALTVAIDQFITIASSPRTDGRVTLALSNRSGKHSFSLTHIQPDPQLPWTRPVTAILQQLRLHQVHFPGFDAAIHGLHSTPLNPASLAALQVAVALAVRQLSPYALTDTASTRLNRTGREGTVPTPTLPEKLRLAELCRKAATDSGAPFPGISLPVTCLFGREFQALEIDPLTRSVAPTPLVGEIGLLLCHTGIGPDPQSHLQQSIRTHCQEAAQVLGRRSLRQIDLDTLRAGQPKLSLRQFQCAYHILAETQRVIFAGRALREDDLPQFGQYLLQSHDSCRDFSQTSSPEQNLLVDLSRSDPACLGARLVGTGSTVHLVRRSELPRFAESVARGCREHAGLEITTRLCRIVTGPC